MAIRARPYENEDDLRRMQALEQFSPGSSPRPKAMCLHQAIVMAGGRDEDERARALYESVGFRRHTRAIQMRKER